ncbi:MAG: lipocalin-like domain-containing protein [Anaerolineae bacterium]
MRSTRIAVSAVGAVILALLVWLAIQPPQRPQASARIDSLPVNPTIDGFARAFEPRPFVFPADHGPHPEYQTEWWYYTGNLQDASGRQFGYQFTIFRRALTAEPITRVSSLASNQLYFAHFALTDIGARRHIAAEKFSRGAGGLAGACAHGSAIACDDSPSFRAFIENWSVTALDDEGNAFRILARDKDHHIDLTLRAVKAVVLHGDRGHSPKGLEPGNASFYYSFTRLETEGKVVLDANEFSVTGLSWMDHEWSTSALGENALGWDWFSIQLDDQRELMLFQIRNSDGSLEPASSGTLIDADGKTIPLTLADFTLEARDTWRSPVSGGEYPVRWIIRIPEQDIELTVEARAPEQEMNVSIVYWEGAIRVTGTAGGQAISGQGYLEMTGYAQSIKGKF